MEPFAANSWSVAICIGFSFYGNRRFTFEHVGTRRVARQFAEFAVMFLATLLISNAALAFVLAIRPDATRLVENLALLLSSGSLVVVRFWLMKYWIFRA